MANRPHDSTACRLSQLRSYPRFAFAFSGLRPSSSTAVSRRSTRMHRFLPRSRRNGTRGTIPRLPACGRVHHNLANAGLASIPFHPNSIPRASSSGRVKTVVILPKTLVTKGTVLAVVSDAKKIVGKEIIEGKEFLSFLCCCRLNDND